MLKIGIISDTHGYCDDRIIHHLSDVDEIWHAGDWGNISVHEQLSALKPLRGVYGNIDGSEIRQLYPKTLRFQAEKMKVMITHIGDYHSRGGAGSNLSLQTGKPDIFICGHSHITKIIKDKNLELLHINPGAAGLYGIHKVRTLVKMEIDNDKIAGMRIVELGKREY